jgi:hypothetical protein
MGRSGSGTRARWRPGKAAAAAAVPGELGLGWSGGRVGELW